jgi:hypothetical protein
MSQVELSRTETIADVIEKLVIANLKTWHLKDAQAQTARPGEPGFGEPWVSRYYSGPIPEEARMWSVVFSKAPSGDVGHFRMIAGDPWLERILLCVNALAGFTNDQLRDGGLVRRLLALVDEDLELCKARANLRREINRLLGERAPDATVHKQYGS